MSMESDGEQSHRGVSEMSQLEANARLHDFVAPRYQARHPEIFNRTEQERLEKELKWAFSAKSCINNTALDFGSGTGNLTSKLLQLGAHVFAADLSPGMLQRIDDQHRDEWCYGRLRTILLDGTLPLPFPAGHFGFVAAYSVLHHVPDYLAA